MTNLESRFAQFLLITSASGMLLRGDVRPVISHEKQADSPRMAPISVASVMPPTEQPLCSDNLPPYALPSFTSEPASYCPQWKPWDGSPIVAGLVMDAMVALRGNVSDTTGELIVEWLGEHVVYQLGSGGTIEFSPTFEGTTADGTHMLCGPLFMRFAPADTSFAYDASQLATCAVERPGFDS